MKNRIKGIACGIFRKEIEELIRIGKLNIPFDFLNSMLHLVPGELESDMNNKIKKSSGQDIILLYGDCQPGISDLCRNGNICRVPGINCCEIILGKSQYNKLRDDGAFFLLPEWTTRWEEVFKEHFGFDERSLKEFMKEMHNKIIYIDTGVQSIPEKTLIDISTFCGLPVEIHEVGLDNLLSAIIETLKISIKARRD